MPKFRYKAVDVDGKKFEGTVDATDRFDVYRQVRKEGQTVVSVSKGGQKGIRDMFNFSYFSSIIGSVKTSEKIIFTRNMAAMLDAGLSVSRALSVMERQTSNPMFRHVLNDVSVDLQKGTSLHESFKKFPRVFSPLFVAMVKAGEESGSLVESFKVIGKQMNQSYQLKKKVKGALMYPAIVITAMVIIGILMLMFVVPTLTETFDELGAELPRSTQAVITVSDFLSENAVLSFGIIIVIIGLLMAAFRTPQGRRVFEFVILHIPVIKGLVKETNSARTARTLSSLLTSGVEVVSALSITREVIQNSYYRAVIQEAEKEIQKGSPMSEVFKNHANLYPILFSEIMAVGEETGKLSSMLVEIAEFFEEEVSQKTKDMSTIIEPFLMLIVGGVVGFFAVSMISPIYSLSDSI